MQMNEPTLFEVPSTSTPDLDAALLDEQAQRYLPILRKLGSWQRHIIGRVYKGWILCASESKKYRRLETLGLLVRYNDPSSWQYYTMPVAVHRACELAPELWVDIETPVHPSLSEFLLQKLRGTRKSPLDVLIDRACGIPD